MGGGSGDGGGGSGGAPVPMAHTGSYAMTISFIIFSSTSLRPGQRVYGRGATRGDERSLAWGHASGQGEGEGEGEGEVDV